VVAGVIGTIQATEALKYVLGIGDLLTGRLLVYDALEMKFRLISVNRSRECPLCGDKPTVTKLIDEAQPACDLKTDLSG
jgi:molybdopterin/thiamine biosynthesis adenylyltransferase